VLSSHHLTWFSVYFKATSCHQAWPHLALCWNPPTVGLAKQIYCINAQVDLTHSPALPYP